MPENAPPESSDVGPGISSLLCAREWWPDPTKEPEGREDVSANLSKKLAHPAHSNPVCGTG